MTHFYRQFRPIEAFRSQIDAYWINRPDGHAADSPSEVEGGRIDRVLPDGCIDLIFRGGDGEARLFSSALIERPIFFDGATRGWYVGVRLRPAMARALIEIDPVDCRDRAVPATQIDSAFGPLERRLQDCASAEQALAMLKRAVEARLTHHERAGAPARVREAIALLARGGDAPQVGRIARMLGIAERTLHRDVLRWSGLAPKPLARILRMQRTLAALRGSRLPRRMPLALVALQMGYADQAHMTRELKALAGFTPAELAPPVRNLQDAA
jgi:AraC-like DNA-binding protein